MVQFLVAFKHFSVGSAYMLQRHSEVKKPFDLKLRS